MWIIVLLCSLFAFAACGELELDSSQAQPQLNAIEPLATGNDLALIPILNERQFEQPIELTQLPDDTFLVAEQRGSLTRFWLDDGELQQQSMLDLTDTVRFRGEEGLLSFALDPNLARRPYIYVYYSPNEGRMTRLSRFCLAQDLALRESELVILEIPQPYSNHNGGAIRFGPDGMLYLGVGDGGSANDPQNNGQNLSTLLGAILRIDVRSIDLETTYRIPDDNPFVGRGDARDEIFAYGLRNLWRMAFDSVSGELRVADVGQNRVEEIAVVRSGENHGWRIFEGNECFTSQSDCDALTDHTPPVATYTHDEGCSVTGGEVYRGRALPQLVGHYFFADYCSGRIWSYSPQGDTVELLQIDERIASFGVDRDGELYLLIFRGPILKLVAE